VLGLLGVKLVSTRPKGAPPPPREFEPTLDGGLHRLLARKLGVRTLIDVGAAEGSWTRAYANVMGRPEHMLLVEAQPVHTSALERFSADFPGAHVVMSAAGPKAGETWFEASQPLGGAASAERSHVGHWIRVPLTTLDHEVASRSLPGPYLVKLDTHGFEMPILAGARAVLASTAALVIECYNFDICDTAQRFPTFCRSMEDLGFRCVDAWDLMYRPRDFAFWQLDLLFVRADRPEFTGPHAIRYEVPGAAATVGSNGTGARPAPPRRRAKAWPPRWKSSEQRS
jgi:FkbM family methyltransferase